MKDQNRFLLLQRLLHEISLARFYYATLSKFDILCHMGKIVDSLIFDKGQKRERSECTHEI